MTYRPRHWISVEEYLHQEELAEYKSEYFNGEIFPMISPPAEHSLISGNLTSVLLNQLEDQPSLVLGSNMLLKVPETGLYTYADAVVAAEPQFEDARRRCLLNPTVVIEVQSPATQYYDRGDKLAHYQRLASLREYVLIASDERRIEVWSRLDHQAPWCQAVCREPGESVGLPAIGCLLPIDRTYHKVEILPQQAESRISPGPP